MNYLNNHLNIIHRDLKGANIFLFQNGERIETKIGDFADSLNDVNTFNKSYFRVGSLRWMVNSLLCFINEWNISFVEPTEENCANGCH